MVRTPNILYILIWKYISYYNGIYFFDILIAKNGPRPEDFLYFDLEIYFHHNGVNFFNNLFSKNDPNMVCFVNFDLEIYFAPQRHVIFYFSSGQLAPHSPF